MMNKLMVAALAAGSMVALAAPAAAQVTGTVMVTGTVAGRCSVVQQGGGASSTFMGTIPLGALDEADGTLRADLEGSTSGAPSGTPVTTRVVCTTAQTDLSISASRFSNALAAVDGYSNDIDYTAEVSVNTAPSGVETLSYSTVGLPAASTRRIGRIAAGSQDNVTVRAYGFAAEGGTQSLLVAGSYLSTITVNINPVL